MKFVSFEKDGKAGLAVQDGHDQLIGLYEDAPDYPGNLDILVRQNSFKDASEKLKAGAKIDQTSIVHTVPFRRANKIICVGLNYSDHAAEANTEVPDFPTVFVRFNSNLVAHEAPLVRPTVSEQLDWEGEMVAVIGKNGRNIAKEDALAHVAGYTVFNDGSIRDFQLRTNQWTVGKNFDGTGSISSTFVTADELPAGGSDLRIQTRLNGEIMQDASTADMIFSTADLVSLLSIGMELEAGDMIVTGTPSGIGAVRKPPIFMKDGDVCEVEVENIGVLRNPVINEPT